MEFVYSYIDASMRGYSGVTVELTECCGHLQGPVKDNLIDREETSILLESLKTLQADTGFENNDRLQKDIQELEEEYIILQDFRVGEAYAEYLLEMNFQCRFHWNELRDARNPKGSKTGADLVGFVQQEEKISFLFGEVKTSSETNKRPPQVMTNSDGIENQIKDLHFNSTKRRVLISYLQNKARHFSEDHPFQVDFKESIKTYYSYEGYYQLIGVLVRDVEPHVQDLSKSYERLSEQISESNGLKLLALYLPYRKEEWLNIINGEKA